MQETEAVLRAKEASRKTGAFVIGGLVQNQPETPPLRPRISAAVQSFRQCHGLAGKRSKRLYQTIGREPPN